MSFKTSRHFPTPFISELRRKWLKSCFIDAVFCSKWYDNKPDFVHKENARRILSSIVFHLDIDVKQLAFFENDFNTNTEIDMEFLQRYFLNFITPSRRRSSLKKMVDISEIVSKACWYHCNIYYYSCILPETAVYKLWRTFNALSSTFNTVTYPPKIKNDQASWLLCKLKTPLNNNSYEADNINEPTFSELYHIVENMLYDDLSVVNKNSFIGCINRCYMGVVLQVVKTGWLRKRSNKLDNWTNWLMRWFVLYQDRIEYHSDKECSDKKGQISLTNDLIITSNEDNGLNNFSELVIHIEQPGKVFEVSASTSEEYSAWLDSIHTVIRLNKKKTSVLEDHFSRISEDNSQTVFFSELSCTDSDNLVFIDLSL